MTAEAFIDINYHMQTDNPNVLINDKTGEEVDYDEVAEEYLIFRLKKLAKGLTKRIIDPYNDPDLLMEELESIGLYFKTSDTDFWWEVSERKKDK